MAWTAPKTWVEGELVSANDMNEVSAQMTYLMEGTNDIIDLDGDLLWGAYTAISALSDTGAWGLNYYNGSSAEVALRVERAGLRDYEMYVRYNDGWGTVWTTDSFPQHANPHVVGSLATSANTTIGTSWTDVTGLSVSLGAGEYFIFGQLCIYQNGSGGDTTISAQAYNNTDAVAGNSSLLNCGTDIDKYTLPFMWTTTLAGTKTIRVRVMKASGSGSSAVIGTSGESTLKYFRIETS